MFNVKYIRGIISNSERHAQMMLYIHKNKTLISK